MEDFTLEGMCGKLLIQRYGANGERYILTVTGGAGHDLSTAVLASNLRAISTSIKTVFTHFHDGLRLAMMLSADTTLFVETPLRAYNLTLKYGATENTVILYPSQMDEFHDFAKTLEVQA